MDSVFTEEKAHLSDVETVLDKHITLHRNLAAQYNREWQEFVAIDYEDQAQKAELYRSISFESDTADKLAALKPEPYFGRLDTEAKGADGEYFLTTAYIGQSPICLDSTEYVIDWRTDFAAHYYMPRETCFTINDNEYTIILRRSFNVRQGILLECNTDYDANDITLEGDIVDSFLITVLKDKRRNHALTDIICTIQANQNAIIRMPFNASFVVQGCAGSGKTMILLHRLSYLLFNNPGVPVSRIKILTPNKNFNTYLNDLSDQLGLHHIGRLTVSEYYAELIKRYHAEQDVAPAIKSEKSLDEHLLAYLYSDNFYELLTNSYHEYWQSVLDEISAVGLLPLLHKVDSSLIIGLPHSAAAYTALVRALEQCTKRNASVRSSLDRLKDRIDKNKKDKLDAENALVSHLAVEQAARHADRQLIIAEISRIDCSATVLHEREELETAIAQLELDGQKVAGDIVDCNTILNTLKKHAEEYSSFNSFKNKEDSISAFIRASLPELVASLHEVALQHSKVPIYNFGKRNALMRRMNELSVSFTENATLLLHSLGEKTSQKLQTYQESFSKNQFELSRLQQQLSELNASLFAVTKSLDTLHHLYDVVAAEKPEDYRPAYGELIDKFFPSTVAWYKKKSLLQKKLDTAISVLNEIVPNYTALAATSFTDAENAILESADSLVNRLRFGSVISNVMLKKVTSAYKDYGVQYAATGYRHKLYIRLLFCTLYYGKVPNSEIYLNIDEAQDMSPTEYKTLRRALGENCILNLYGDVNQLVYSYKGIKDWTEIPGITDDDVHVLNENYRNTNEITLYCNSAFGSEIIPIGISGEPVYEETLESALLRITEYKKSNPSSRVAVLYRHGYTVAPNECDKFFSRLSPAVDILPSVDISILTVEEAKGLEFEAVVAITDGMTENEKYIAFTRALSLLSVVTIASAASGTAMDSLYAPPEEKKPGFWAWLRSHVSDERFDVYSQAVNTLVEIGLPIRSNSDTIEITSLSEFKKAWEDTKKGPSLVRKHNNAALQSTIRFITDYFEAFPLYQAESVPPTVLIDPPEPEVPREGDADVRAPKAPDVGTAPSQISAVAPKTAADAILATLHARYSEDAPFSGNYAELVAANPDIDFSKFKRHALKAYHVTDKQLLWDEHILSSERKEL